MVKPARLESVVRVMRLLAEILIVALLIGTGWNRSFREWVSETPLTARSDVATSVAPRRADRPAGLPQPSASVFGAWMWDKERRTALDRPAYNPREPDPRYVDADGRSYRLAPDGKRHYDPLILADMKTLADCYS